MTNRPIIGHGDRWVGLLAILVPRGIRDQFVGDLLAERKEMRESGVAPTRMNLASFATLLNGAAQHIPLKPAPIGRVDQPETAERAARIGWAAWRFCGPALFFGHVARSWPLFGVGAALLVAAFTCLVVVASTGHAPLSERQTRLANGVLVGTLLVVAVVLLFGVVAVGLIGLSAVFSSGLIAAIAVHAVVFVATASACLVTGSGWVPEEWYPRRLVENRS